MSINNGRRPRPTSKDRVATSLVQKGSSTTRKGKPTTDETVVETPKPPETNVLQQESLALEIESLRFRHALAWSVEKMIRDQNPILSRDVPTIIADMHHRILLLESHIRSLLEELDAGETEEARNNKSISRSRAVRQSITGEIQRSEEFLSTVNGTPDSVRVNPDGSLNIKHKKVDPETGDQRVSEVLLEK